MGLFDSPTVGGKFTWFRSDGSAMSRLDRFLMSEGLIRVWNIANQFIGNRDLSDHCPIWVKGNIVNWGAKPFKFFNCWLQHEGFMPFILKSWNSMNILGSSGFILKEKLKCMKGLLKFWNWETFGILDLELDIIVDFLKNLDSLASSNAYNSSLSEVTKGVVSKLW